MKFNLGRSQSDSDKSIEEEALERWRAVSQESGQKKERVIDVTLPGDKLAAEESAVTPEALSDLPAGDPRVAPQADLERRFGTSLRSALGPGTVIQGKLIFEAPVRIDGNLSGEVGSTSVLVVGEQGTVDATLNVGSLVVLGQVSGDIDANDLVEIKAGGRVEGSINTKRLVIEPGGFLEGNCKTAKRLV